MTNLHKKTCTLARWRRPRSAHPRGIAEHPGLRELLEQVLTGVQVHVQGVREDVVQAVDALDPLRSADLRPEVQSSVQVFAAQLTSIIAHLGDIQLLLTAATQTLVAREHADSHLAPDGPE